MDHFLGFSRLRDISISKKLYFIVGAMAILVVLELLTLWFSIHTLSSLRALVGGEGLWSKAQKDAVFELEKYSRTHNETAYQAFHRFMRVPWGDHQARLELLKKNPNLEIIRNGFLEGRIHSDDIDGITRLIRRFHEIYYLKKALAFWGDGDALLEKLIPISEKLHEEITSASTSKVKLDLFTAEIDPINENLTTLEDNFSYTLGEGSRWLEHLILDLLFIVALTVEITGLSLSIIVSRSITRGLKEISRAAKNITKGSLGDRATVFSDDEIGGVAVAMNQMTEQLIRSNKELGQYAYIASHDLQEPLRTISNFTGLLQKQYKGKLDQDGDNYLDIISSAADRMRTLIKEVLDYSVLGHDKRIAVMDCNALMQEVLENMSTSIKESSAEIRIKPLPVLNGFSELKMVFQNLISNAIKFRKPDTPVIITVSARASEKEWLFSIKDNGIGIEDAYHERIFAIFRKLHSRKLYEGTGIGLAHCKKIIDFHGGKIWVESQLGHGSTFYFTIPITAANA